MSRLIAVLMRAVSIFHQPRGRGTKLQDCPQTTSSFCGEAESNRGPSARPKRSGSGTQCGSRAAVAVARWLQCHPRKVSDILSRD